MAGAEIGVSSTNVTPSSGRLAPGKLSWAFALIICRERQPLLHGNLFHTVRFSLVCALLWSVTVCKIPICIWTRAFERQRGNAGERPSRRSEVINERTHSWAWNGWGNEASLCLILLMRIFFSVLFYVWRSLHFLFVPVRHVSNIAKPWMLFILLAINFYSQLEYDYLLQTDCKSCWPIACHYLCTALCAKSSLSSCTFTLQRMRNWEWINKVLCKSTLFLLWQVSFLWLHWSLWATLHSIWTWQHWHWLRDIAPAQSNHSAAL